MYYLLVILLGLIALSIAWLCLRPTRVPPAQRIFYGRAIYAHRCASANLHKLQKDFAAWVRQREGAHALVVYPEWIRELEAEIIKLGKRLDESVLVLPFTKLSNDAIQMRERVKEARTEVEQLFRRSQAVNVETRPGNLDSDMISVSKGRAAPISPWEPVEPKPQPQATTRPLRRAQFTAT